MNNFFLKYINIFYFLLFFLSFVAEYIYNLPSPTGDDKFFINLFSNICLNNSFTSEFLPQFEGKWEGHGFFREYLFGKLNYNCSIENYFLINFTLKIITFFLIINISRDQSNFFFKFSLVLLTFLCQSIISFRPEGFAILIIFLILHSIKNNNCFLLGFCASTLLFSQPTIFFLFGSIFFLLNFFFIISSLKKIILGFLCCFIFIYYIYPYNILEYFNFAKDSGAYHYKWFSLESFSFHFIYTNFFPFFIFYFLFLFFILLRKFNFLIIIFPIIILFGPLSSKHEYNLIAITPYLLFCVYDKCKINFRILVSYITIFIFVIGYFPFLTRNLFTIVKFGNNFSQTSQFIKNNINKINVLPSFVKLTNPEILLKNHDQPMNKELIYKNYKFDIYEVNGSRHNCPTLSSMSPSLSFMNFRIFNSNSSYDVYVCKK
jgi:hypothetical protein